MRQVGITGVSGRGGGGGRSSGREVALRNRAGPVRRIGNRGHVDESSADDPPDKLALSDLVRLPVAVALIEGERREPVVATGGQHGRVPARLRVGKVDLVEDPDLIRTDAQRLGISRAQQQPRLVLGAAHHTVIAGKRLGETRRVNDLRPAAEIAGALVVGQRVPEQNTGRRAAVRCRTELHRLLHQQMAQGGGGHVRLPSH